MSKKRYAYQYEFRFVMDEADGPFYHITHAFGFMPAYSQALRALRKKHPKTHRKYKLDDMSRVFHGTV